VSFLRVGDEIINLMALARAEFTACNPDGFPVCSLWYIGDPEPKNYYAEPAQLLWNAIGRMGTRIEMFGR
jgi:hypothetical protein